MRRYQLSGLEHVHVMRHVPRSYDMTRTHILHKSVNRHVDVVLRCSPKNWKKKKVTVSVVKSEKKTDAARIRANAKKGYVAVRKATNEQYEADRRAVASAYDSSAYAINYGTRSGNSDMLIHDMKSQIAAMARNSADYIDDQLSAKPVVSYTEPAAQNVENTPPVEPEKPLISPETEDILRKGGYRIPVSKPSKDNPYATDYLMNASNEEFHLLMDSLEKTLDEACRKYATEPYEPDVVPQTETQSDAPAEPETKTETESINYSNYSGYNGGYNLPGDISLSVNKKQEIKADEKEKEIEFKPTLTFTEGGEHYIPEDDLFDRHLNRPGERYVPPAYFFDDDDGVTPENQESDNTGYVPLPEPESLPAVHEPKKQEIFYTENSDQSLDISEGYPREDYVQQQILLPTEPDGESSVPLYTPPQEDDDYALPTLFHDYNNDVSEEAAQEEDGYELPMIFPDKDEPEGSRDIFNFTDEETEPPMSFPYTDEKTEPPVKSPYTGEEPEPSISFPYTGGETEPPVNPPYTDDDIEPPMIFPDEDDEDLPPPMIFPDSDEEEGYSPAPVSPDRNDYYGDVQDNRGIMDRSGQKLFSRTGDQIKKVIGVIRGSSETDVNARKRSDSAPNHNVEITYSDRDN